MSRAIKQHKNLFQHTSRGSMLIFVMVFGAIAFTTIVMGVSGYALFEHKASTRVYRRDMALHIAEAGVNYYRWHLAHNFEDYYDGTGGDPGPYVHEYEDKDGNVIGYFSLEIDEPLSGAHVVTVRSTGWTTQQPNSRRTLQVRLGFPSLADYAFVENADMRFSHTTEVHGKVHSNGYIDFDGLTDSWIDSARENGIWGDGGPTEFWRYPVPAKDFYGVTADLAAIRDMADDGGLHFNSAGSRNHGYYFHFNGDGTFTRRKVKNRSCYYGLVECWRGLCWGNVCYDRGQLRNNTRTYTIPDNGAIFVEDNVWVDGVVDGRVTIGAGRFPTGYQEIYISGNLTYVEKGSDDVLGLIAQGDIIVPRNVPDNMEIDAAVLSQYGSIHRPYYLGNIKNSLLFFGSQISFEGGGWKWGNPVQSGFVNTNHTYDGNLLYYPPPGFPVEPTYNLISWEEIE